MQEQYGWALRLFTYPVLTDYPITVLAK
jgi:nitrogen fixation protein